MNIQPNKPLSIAVLQARNGEIPGFEDLCLLTYQNTLRDICASVSDEQTARKILREVYEEVWRRRASLPETGIVRPWIRLIIRDAVKKETGQTIEEFSSEVNSDEIRELDNTAAQDLLMVEEALGLFSLPDSITGRKRRNSLPESVLRFLFSLCVIGAAVLAAALLMRSAGRITKAEKERQNQTVTVEAEAETGETEETAETSSVGWNETKNGRRYRLENGSWLESAWLEDGEFLYYLDEDGYALTGNRQFGVQNFTFDDTGALTGISRAFGRETSRTVLSVQMENFGHGDDAENIIDDSITLDDSWIYYLYRDNASNPLPILLRVMRDSDDTELIAEDVTGYTVQQNSVWYCSGGKIQHFEKGTEGTAVGGTYTVTEENGSWYLKDAYGRNVAGSGGYETIGRRVYRVEDGRIKYVRPDTQKIDNYTFRCEEAGISPVIRLGDGREYLRQGLAVDSLATLGETLYYSVLLEGGRSPVSRIWKVDIYTGAASPVSEAFPGRILTMYPYSDRSEIYMEYRPGTSLYGRAAVISGGKAYVLKDETARAGGFGNGQDLLEPVWVEGDDVRCYWDNCSGTASDGTIQVLDTRTLTLSASDRTALGGASAASSEPVFFGGTQEETPETKETGEISEDEMIQSGAEEKTEAAENAGTGMAPGSVTESESGETAAEGNSGQAPAAEQETSAASGAAGPGAAAGATVEAAPTQGGSGPQNSAGGSAAGPGSGRSETVSPVPIPQ